MSLPLAVMLFTAIAMGAWSLVVRTVQLGRRPGAGVFVAMSVALALLSTMGLVQTLVTDPAATVALVRVQYALRTVTAAVWLVALLRWAAPPFVRHPRTTLTVLATPAVAFAVAALVTPLGGPMLTSVTRSDVVPWAVAVVPGPWTLWLNVPYALVLMLLAAAVVIATPVQHRGFGRLTRAGWLVATAVTVVAALLAVFESGPIPGYVGAKVAVGVVVVVLHATLTTTPAFARRELAFRAAFDAMHEAALIVGSDGTVLEANPAAAKVLGAEAPLQGANLMAVAPQLEVARRRGVGRTTRVGGAGDLAGFEVSAATARTNAGAGPATVLVLHDRRAEQARAAQLVARSQRDALTGAANRLGFEAAFGHALATARGRAVALVYIDLDGFKPVNDTHGHAVGDEVLVEVARRLHATVRDRDVVARVGGDEFALVLVDVTPSVLADVAQRAAAAIATPIATSAGMVRIGASLGLATAPRDGTTLEQVVQVADARMYRQKQARPDRGGRRTPPPLD